MRAFKVYFPAQLSTRTTEQTRSPMPCHHQRGKGNLAQNESELQSLFCIHTQSNKQSQKNNHKTPIIVRWPKELLFIYLYSVCMYEQSQDASLFFWFWVYYMIKETIPAQKIAQRQTPLSQLRENSVYPSVHPAATPEPVISTLGPGASSKAVCVLYTNNTLHGKRRWIIIYYFQHTGLCDVSAIHT